MIQLFLGILAFGMSGLAVASADRHAASMPASSSSMRFEWHAQGTSRACGKDCRTWISASGTITENTARDFEDFARTNNIRGATLVLDSDGGSVVAALALGRAIRRLDMTTTVGRTIVPSNGKARTRLSADATCESMCAFVLLGGTRRHVPPQARVLVHMIWLGNKSEHAQDASYSADELGLVQQDIGSIARYIVDMGGNIELLETALQVPPWKPLHELTTDEIRRMRLSTLESPFVEDIAPVAVAQ